MEEFVAKAQAVTVGNGLDAGTEMGPVANHRRIEALEALTADARARGGRVLTGGERLGNRGYFFPPTVLTELPDDARALREEPFGPMAIINARPTADQSE